MCNILPAILHKVLERCTTTITEGVKHDGICIIDHPVQWLVSKHSHTHTLTHTHTQTHTHAA